MLYLSCFESLLATNQSSDQTSFMNQSYLDDLEQ